jgi:hypothetical protein
MQRKKTDRDHHRQNTRQIARAVCETPLTDLERAALEMLLRGDNTQLAVLREQLAKSVVSKRESTGTGIYVHFGIPSDIARISRRTQTAIGDVSARIHGLEHGAGFVSFVNNGTLDVLEGFTYDEPWPARTDDFELTYLEEMPRGSGRLHASSVRDVEFGLRDLAARE